MSESVTPASGEPGKATPVLSEQQRIWVREVVERLRKRQQDNSLRSHPGQDAASGGYGEPAGCVRP